MKIHEIECVEAVFTCMNYDVARTIKYTNIRCCGTDVRVIKFKPQ